MVKVGIFAAVLTALFFYTRYRVQFFVPDPRQAALLTGLIFGLMLGWNIAYRASSHALDSGWFRWFAWIGSTTFGFWATYMIYALCLDIGTGALDWLGGAKGVGMDPERRNFLLQSGAWGLLGFSGIFTTLGFVVARKGPQVKEVRVPVAGLPKELHNLKIAQITDLHVGPTIGRDYVEDVVQRTLALNPDIIVITGDLADGTPDALRDESAPLARLRGRLGTFYVTGNHEYYWGGEDWVRAVREFGWTPLLNEHVVLSVGGRSLLVAGVTDESAGQFVPEHQSDPHRAIQGGEAADFKLLLAHRPNTCLEAARLGYHLQLSGHTHGGQFFPFHFFVQLVHKYYRGLHQHEGLWVYVSVGTGYWGPPHRFGVPSEITLLQLSSALV